MGEERFSADWRVLALHLTGNNEEEDMDSHPARLPSATPGKGVGPTESYKERAIRYRAEVHSLRAEVKVKALKDEFSGEILRVRCVGVWMRAKDDAQPTLLVTSQTPPPVRVFGYHGLVHVDSGVMPTWAQTEVWVASPESGGDDRVACGNLSGCWPRLGRS